MYRIEIESDADKVLRRMPRNTARRIRSKLFELAADPFARRSSVKKLVGRDAYRLRIGNWRALYTIDTANRTISVIVVKPRGSVYE